MNATLLDTHIDSKDLKVLSKNIKDFDKNHDKEFFKSLLELSQKQSNDKNSEDLLVEKFLNFSNNSDDEKLLQTLLNANKKSNIKSNSSDEKSAEILVEDLLNLSFSLKNNVDIKDIQVSNKKSKVVLEDKNFVHDVKSAKNMSELLNVAKKYDIKVTKFEFSKEQTVVEQKKSKGTKEFKSEDILNIMDKKLDNSIKKLVENIKNDKRHKENTLKNILSKVEVASNPGIKKVDTKEVFIPKVETLQKRTDAKEVKTEQINQDIKLKPQTKETKTEQIAVKTQPKVEKTLLETKEQKIDAKEKQSENPKIKLEDSSLRVTEQIVKKQNIDKVVQHTSQTIQTIEKEFKQDLQDKDKTTFEEVTKVEHTTHTQKTQIIKPKVEVKHTLNTFAQDFKEQVESYKPPLMKVKMQLNPKGLGEVDVTMINRGNNLHITVNSNPNTIAIFSQNQTEFKNSLISMGFSELNMSFNENGQNRDNSQSKKRNSQNQSNHDEVQPIDDSFEIVTPIYV